MSGYRSLSRRDAKAEYEYSLKHNLNTVNLYVFDKGEHAFREGLLKKLIMPAKDVKTNRRENPPEFEDWLKGELDRLGIAGAVEFHKFSARAW